MMKKVKRYLSLLLAFPIFFSCEDIFEKDISAKVPVIISPADGLSYNRSDILFWWEYMNGADYYQLQIAKPGFDLIEQLVTDTITEANKLIVILDTGTYEWRIRACNIAYCTDYVYRSLEITGK